MLAPMALSGKTTKAFPGVGPGGCRAGLFVSKLLTWNKLSDLTGAATVTTI